MEFCEGAIFPKRTIVMGPFMKKMSFCEEVVLKKRNFSRGCFSDAEFCEGSAKHPKISPGSNPVL